jgi:signal transduction histidine kinase
MEEGSRKSLLHEPAGRIDDLFAVLTHEIANPLNNISAAVQLMDEYLHDSENRVNEAFSELLRLLTEEVKRLTLLLEDFRSLQLFNLDLQPISLASLIKDALALESIKDASCQIHIEFDFPSDLPLIMADAAKLKQVVLNLCRNAAEAMPHGGTVTVRAYTRPAKVCLEVTDRGEGIPEGMDVFAPFVTNKPTGSGLGLFVAQSIVSAHGGTITYTSKKGEGTVFHLTFPSGSDGTMDPQRSVPLIPDRRFSN